METLKKYQRELITGAGAALVGWFLYKASTNKEDQYEDENVDIKIKKDKDGQHFSKQTILDVYKQLHKRAMAKTLKLVINTRKKRRQHKKDFNQYVKIVTEGITKRDNLIEKANMECLKELKIDPTLWHKSLEHYHLTEPDDGDFKNQLTEILSIFPEAFEYKIITPEELDKIIDFMIQAAENEDPEYVKEMVILSSFDSGLGIEVMEARVYDKLFEKFKVEEDDIHVSLRKIPKTHEVHKKFEVFQDLVDEITSGFKDYGGEGDEEEEPAYVDGPDNEEDYEDVSDEEQ